MYERMTAMHSHCRIPPHAAYLLGIRCFQKTQYTVYTPQAHTYIQYVHTYTRAFRHTTHYSLAFTDTHTQTHTYVRTYTCTTHQLVDT